MGSLGWDDGGVGHGDLRELPRVPLRGEGSCGGGGAPRDSAGSGATEEGLTSRGGIIYFWLLWVFAAAVLGLLSVVAYLIAERGL